ncbi:hypothetical protein SORBI_3001G031000 [Sorghum bicolor]|jgi:hypothetical protein|uniref:NAC domain-containing protein n=1 Tax=Sorghum bicolor TaxID=4558 RepID=C5WUY1_SORBI|nr:hypothetical protein SORBI_3001G031000 [Sorghum bicolor]
MATNADDVFRPTDKASIALLRGLRSKTIVDRTFIHRVDICSAAPEELVADLQPVPGTDVTEDGYNSVWYIYCLKRYKNTRGKPSGRRQRAVEPDGKTSWHSETGPKPVQGVPGGATFCNFSYGRKEKDGASGRQRLDRMGWCMTEFDDTQGGGGDHVLCRLHRSSSSLAKKKSKSSSSSSSKRKAAADHPEAPPTKLIHNEQVQMQDPAAFFPNAYPTMPCYGYGPPQGVDPVTTIGGEEEYGVQQPRVEPEYGGEFNFDELLNIDEQEQVQMQDAASFPDAYPTMPCHGYGPPQGVDPVMMIGGEEEYGVQQPRVEPDYGGEFNSDELLNIDEQVQMQDPAAFFTNGYPTIPACYGHGGPQGVDPVTFGDVEPEHGGDLGVFNFQDLLKTDEWKDFEEFLAAGEQGLHCSSHAPSSLSQSQDMFLSANHVHVA